MATVGAVAGGIATEGDQSQYPLGLSACFFDRHHFCVADPVAPARSGAAVLDDPRSQDFAAGAGAEAWYDRDVCLMGAGMETARTGEGK